eukprot:PhF_6_TR27000/c0_g1_i1/m.39415
MEVKWFILMIVSVMCCGTAYVYDFPGSIGIGKHGSIQAQFHSHNVTYTQTMNQGLYSAYSFPNVVNTVVGGMLIDRYVGIRRATVAFGVVCVVGSTVFYLGTWYVSYPLLVVGRVMLGGGCECMNIAQNAWATRWFGKKKQGMAFAFGIAQGLQRSGSSLNFFLSPRLVEGYGIDGAVFGGIVACGVAVICAIVVVIVDIFYESQLPVNVLQSNKNGVEAIPPTTQPSRPSCSNLPKEFWVLNVTCALLYAGTLPFIGVANDYIQKQYDYSPVSASSVVGVFSIVSAVGAPFVGAAVDRTGRVTFWITGCGCMLASACCVLVFGGSSVPAVVPVVMMAVSYTTFAATIWPSVPHTVPSSMIGMAFGIMVAFIAGLGGSMRLLSGALLDSFHGDPLRGYQVLFSVLGGISGIATVGSIILYIFDSRREIPKLTLSSAERQRRMELLIQS